MARKLVHVELVNTRYELNIEDGKVIASWPPSSKLKGLSLEEAKQRFTKRADFIAWEESDVPIQHL